MQRSETIGDVVLCASDNSPDRTIELEGEYDVISATYLTNEAPLRAQVALVHVFGGVLYQRHQVGCILALCYLRQMKEDV